MKCRHELRPDMVPCLVGKTTGFKVTLSCRPGRPLGVLEWSLKSRHGQGLSPSPGYSWYAEPGSMLRCPFHARELTPTFAGSQNSLPQDRMGSVTYWHVPGVFSWRKKEPGSRSCIITWLHCGLALMVAEPPCSLEVVSSRGLIPRPCAVPWMQDSQARSVICLSCFLGVSWVL